MIDRIFSFFRKKYKQSLKFLFHSNYQTLNKIEISRDNLLHNYRYLSSLDRKVRIAPVVKSNGYGHGITNVAKIFSSLKIPFLCVDNLFEAYQLQKAGIKTPILIMGYTNTENFKIKKLPFSFVIFDLETAKILNEFQPGCKIHIFVDTGMHREGVAIEELPEFLNQARKLSNIKVEGLMSHLASSTGRQDPLFLTQIKQFEKAKEILKKHKVNPKWFHIGATGSIINPETRPIIAKVSNLARAGLALYGYSPYPNCHSEAKPKNLSRMRDSSNKLRDPSLITQDDTTCHLKPTLKLTTKIVQIKKISKGEKLGYDGTYTAKKDMLIGVLPIGYYDGVNRRLSNKGVFLVDSHPCPLLGRVSMNVNIINLEAVPNPKVGQEVVVYSNNPRDKNSIDSCARICKTIPYDLLVNLAETTKRVIV